MKEKLMIRIGLGVFFLVWAILKLVHAPFFVNGPYKTFYGMTFPIALVYVVAIIQLGVAAAFFANKYITVAGIISSIMLAATILATLGKILSTFSLPPAEGPPGFLFFAIVPLFFMALSQAVAKN